MQEVRMAQAKDLEALARLRVEQQVEDWENTLPSEDFRQYTEAFYAITCAHLTRCLNRSLFFAIMYIDETPVAMCGLEETDELPQITVCTQVAYRHGWLVSAYTKPQYRGNGYMQALVTEVLQCAKENGFSDLTLTTNTPDAMHIYEKVGFRYVSDKYYLALR